MKKYLKVSEVAERLGLTTTTVRKYESEGRLPALRDLNNHRRFDIAEVVKFEDEFLPKD